MGYGSSGTLVKVLSRASLGLGWLVALFLAACGTYQVRGKTNLAPAAPVPRATSTPTAQSEKPSSAPPTPTPTATRDVVPVTPTPAPASEIAPDFDLSDLNGETWTLSQFRGQPVMLFFWATW